MLSHLSIRNYALIAHLEIDFDAGLTTITGETGAGKSILLGALSLILGQRADTQALHDKKQKCIVEGVFDIKNYRLSDFFLKNNLDYEEKTTIRREINPAGNSRAFINDTPVSLQQLKELGLNLVDIHSQHESLLLNSTEFQFNILDSFCRQKDSVNEYKKKFREFQGLLNELRALQEKEQKSKLDKDFFQFQYDELENAKLSEGEQEQMEQDLEIQNNSEEIKKNIFETVTALSQGERSLVSMLNDVKRLISDAARFNPKLSDVEQRLNSTSIELEDISAELEKIQEQISFSPEKMEVINERLNTLNSLQQKHRVKTTGQLIAVKNTIQEKLSAITTLSAEIEKLSGRINSGKKDLLKRSDKISENRKKAVPKIEKNVNAMLQELGMPWAKIEISLSPALPGNSDAEGTGLTVHGSDEICFLFTANKGSQPKEIHKVASGGELSRLMLAVKSLIAQLTSLPTIIFDEIDTGVSGEVADKVGNIMKRMTGGKEPEDVSKQGHPVKHAGMQVISITHLPQIACKGNNHFFVYKENKNGSTVTLLKKLSPKERIHEVARLLSGEELTVAAIENAKELLGV